MIFSDFGQRFSAHSGVTSLMDDLNEGLRQEAVIMMGGGNPAIIPAAVDIFENTLEDLKQSGELLQALVNYDGPQGKDIFIETLADFFQRHNQWPVTAANIALTNGSQNAFFVLFNALAGRSQGMQKKVLIPLVPEYIGYCDVGIEADLIRSQEAKIQRLEAGYFKYQVDFEELEIDRNIGLICVSRPSNPSGNVLTDAECQKLDQIARDNDLPLLIDSAYGAPFPNIIFGQVNPFWNQNTILCMSLSKLGLPGVRTGIVIANEAVIQLFKNMTAITSLAPGGIGPVIANQLIQQNLLTGICNDIIRPFYQQRAQLAISMLREAIDDVRVNIHKLEGSLFLWLWFEDLPITSSELYLRLKSRGLLVVPGKYFFPGQVGIGKHAESCIRMSYAQSTEALRKGIDILADELRTCWQQ